MYGGGVESIGHTQKFRYCYRNMPDPCENLGDNNEEPVVISDIKCCYKAGESVLV